MVWDCTICTAMYGNGAATGTMRNIMMNVKRWGQLKIPPGQIPVRTALFAAVAGAVMRRTAGRLIATTAAPTSAAATLASALVPSRSLPCEIC